MILWILFDCLLYGLTLFENGPNTDALTARIDVKNIIQSERDSSPKKTLTNLPMHSLQPY